MIVQNHSVWTRKLNIYEKKKLHNIIEFVVYMYTEPSSIKASAMSTKLLLLGWNSGRPINCYVLALFLVGISSDVTYDAHSSSVRPRTL